MLPKSVLQSQSRMCQRTANKLLYIDNNANVLPTQLKKQQNGRTLHEDSADHEHATHTFGTVIYTMILTDSRNVIEKIKAGRGIPDWHSAMTNLDTQNILSVKCPGHDEVKRNDRSSQLAGNATITTGLRLGR